MEKIEFIDLGLSVKWADRNVGANSSTDSGDYYTFSDVQNYSNSEWRVPTKKQFEELLKNCEYKWTERNEVKGCLFTSKINGNSIFFPAAGRRYDSEVDYVGSDGFYWSSSACSHKDYANIMYINNDNVCMFYYSECSNGQSVRLVK